MILLSITLFASVILGVVTLLYLMEEPDSKGAKILVILFATLIVGSIWGALVPYKETVEIEDTIEVAHDVAYINVENRQLNLSGTFHRNFDDGEIIKIRKYVGFWSILTYKESFYEIYYRGELIEARYYSSLFSS